MRTRRALIVVDFQNDFCPGGALPVRNADKIIEPTNKMISKFLDEGSPVFFTRDWHPRDHCSFRPDGPWPPHCVKNTPGADFHRALLVPKHATIVSKATTKNSEAYSGFEGTDLAERLTEERVREVYVAGLATDYCIKNTALDAASDGFVVNIISDCVKGVNVKPQDSANAFRAMVSKGVRKTTSEAVLRS